MLVHQRVYSIFFWLSYVAFHPPQKSAHLAKLEDFCRFQLIIATVSDTVLYHITVGGFVVLFVCV